MDVTADGLSDLLVQGLDASNDQTLTNSDGFRIACMCAFFPVLAVK
jgi:hypothetical protein